MKCPHCGEEIAGIPCPECQSLNPETAKYCMTCGAHVEEKKSGTNDEEVAFDLEDRVLCPDGTCTGIIVNGRCTECGKAPGEEESPGNG